MRCGKGLDREELGHSLRAKAEEAEKLALESGWLLKGELVFRQISIIFALTATS